MRETITQLAILLLGIVIMGTPDSYGFGNITLVHMLLQIAGCSAAIALLGGTLKTTKK